MRLVPVSACVSPCIHVYICIYVCLLVLRLPYPQSFTSHPIIFFIFIFTNVLTSLCPNLYFLFQFLILKHILPIVFVLAHFRIQPNSLGLNTLSFSTPAFIFMLAFVSYNGVLCGASLLFVRVCLAILGFF